MHYSWTVSFAFVCFVAFSAISLPDVDAQTTTSPDLSNVLFREVLTATSEPADCCRKCKQNPQCDAWIRVKLDASFVCMGIKGPIPDRDEDSSSSSDEDDDDDEPAFNPIAGIDDCFKTPITPSPTTTTITTSTTTTSPRTPITLPPYNPNPGSFPIQWKAHLDRMITENSGSYQAYLLSPNGPNNSPGSKQLFEWVNGDQLRLFGTNRCLHVKDGTIEQGHPVQIWPCQGSVRQQWRKSGDSLVWNGPGFFTQKNQPPIPICLDIDNGRYNPGALLQIWECMDIDRQKFVLPRPVFGIYWKEHLDRVVTVPDGSDNRDGTLIKLYAPRSLITLSSNQLFEWVNGHQLRLINTNKCLDVKDGTLSNGANGVPIHLWTCDSTNLNQQWEKVDDRLRWKHGNNKCLDVSAGQIAVGAQLQIWECQTNNANQLFIQDCIQQCLFQ